MEHGFYHPERGYWQTISEPSAETLATYPTGTISVPLKPGPHFDWVDGVWQPVPPVPPSMDDYTTAIDLHVEAAAQSKGYNSAAHLSGYATSTVHKWASEAAAFISWRDQVWLTAIEILRQVTAGEIEQPTIEDLIASLPVIDWPAEQLE